MTDHAGGETAMVDILEGKVAEYLTQTMGSAFTDKTKEEQVDMCRMHRRFCYEHKIDNLCKEASAGLAKWAAENKYLDKTDLKAL
eukprot:444044-Rhodomonas_salina.1